MDINKEIDEIKINLRKELDKFITIDADSEIFHYTYTSSLTNIIKTLTLRASNIYFMNDKSEII